MKNIKIDIKKIISEQIDTQEKNITSRSLLIEDLGFDSLDTIEFIMSLEEKFDLEISDEESKTITSVQNAIDFVRRRKHCA